MGKNNVSYAWNKVQTANGEAKTKTVGELIYHCLKCHAVWVLHKPEVNGPNRFRLCNNMSPAQAKSPGPAGALASALLAIFQDAQYKNEE